VVQFCFCDISTRGIRFAATTMPDNSAVGRPPVAGNNPSDWAVLQQLAGRKDGFDNDTSRILD
jgi:hypothetical protein